MKESEIRFIERLKPLINDPDDKDLWSIRSELHRLKTILFTSPGLSDSAIDQLIERLLDIDEKYYKFILETRSKMNAETYNKIATVFDLGAVVALGAEDFLAGESLDVAKLMIGFFAGSLNILGSVQYILAWSDETETLIQNNAINLYDKFWDLPRIFEYKFKDEQLIVIQEELDKFFSQMRNEKVQQEIRIVLIKQLYLLILKLYLYKLIEKLR